ncbi:thioredoxin [bacterium]|nr:thioredoxin [bacterium]
MTESENIIEITSKDQFDEAVKSETLIIVDFWAVWCGPCRVLKPLLHKIAGEHPEIQLLTVDVDANQELAAQYDINSIPAVFMFKNGEIVDSFVGVMPENEILEKIESNK